MDTTLLNVNDTGAATLTFEDYLKLTAKLTRPTYVSGSNQDNRQTEFIANMVLQRLNSGHSVFVFEAVTIPNSNNPSPTIRETILQKLAYRYHNTHQPDELSFKIVQLELEVAEALAVTTTATTATDDTNNNSGSDPIFTNATYLNFCKLIEEAHTNQHLIMVNLHLDPNNKSEPTPTPLFDNLGEVAQIFTLFWYAYYFKKMADQGRRDSAYLERGVEGENEEILKIVPCCCFISPFDQFLDLESMEDKLAESYVFDFPLILNHTNPTQLTPIYAEVVLSNVFSLVCFRQPHSSNLSQLELYTQIEYSNMPSKASILELWRMLQDPTATTSSQAIVALHGIVSGVPPTTLALLETTNVPTANI
jgi:hypothetical protein